MSLTIDKVRERYPAYKDVSDDDLALRIGSKYPAYLDSDPEFKTQFQSVVADKAVSLAKSGTYDFLKVLSNPAAGEAAESGREQSDKQSQALDFATTAPVEATNRLTRTLQSGAIGAEEGRKQAEKERALMSALDNPPLDLQKPRMPAAGEMSTTYGGPPKTLASFQETIAETKEELFNPRLTAPRFKINATDNPAITVGKEAANIAASVPEFFTSDVGVAGMVTGTVAPVATGGAFLVDMIHSLGGQIKDTYKNWDKMTRNQKIAALTDIAGTGLFSALLGHGIKSKLRPEASKGREGSTAFKMPSLATETRTKLVQESMWPWLTDSQKSEWNSASPEVQQRAAALNVTSHNLTEVLDRAKKETTAPEPKTAPKTIPALPQEQQQLAKAAEQAKPVAPMTAAAIQAQAETLKTPQDALEAKSATLTPKPVETPPKAKQGEAEAQPVEEKTGQSAKSQASERITAASFTNAETGKTTTGVNHIEAAKVQGVEAPMVPTDRHGEEYGFEVQNQDTGEVRYVSRDEAEKIARDNGQLLDEPQSGNLHSEEIELAPKKGTENAIQQEAATPVRDVQQPGGESKSQDQVPADETGEKAGQGSGEVPQETLELDKADPKLVRRLPVGFDEATVRGMKGGKILVRQKAEYGGKWMWVDVKKATAENYTASPPAADAAKQKPRATGPNAKRFHAETAQVGQDLMSFINENDGIMSWSDFSRKKKTDPDTFRLNKSEYDDIKGHRLPIHHNIGIYGGRTLPNVMAQMAFEAGLIQDATPSALWERIKADSQTRMGLKRGEAKATATLSRGEQMTVWNEATKEGPGRTQVNLEMAAPGDSYEINGQKVIVTHRDGNTGTLSLDGGEKFGQLKVKENEPFYADKVFESETPSEGAGADWNVGEETPTEVAKTPDAAAEPIKPVAKPAVEPKAKAQERALTKAEQDEFRQLSILVRANREESGPQLTTAQTQRYEHLTELAGQQSFGLELEQNKASMRAEVVRLERESEELASQPYKGKGAKERGERMQEIDRRIQKLKSDMTEGEGEIVHRTPVAENQMTGQMESQEFRMRQLTSQEFMEAVGDPQTRMREFGTVYEPWVAESRRVYYSQDGATVESRDPWYRDAMKPTREAAIQEAGSYSGRTAKKWKEIASGAPEPESVKPPKLGSMEKGTGDLLKNVDEGFALAGERGTDNERVAAEKSKAEKIKAEAKELEAKQQGDLLNPAPKEPEPVTPQTSPTAITEPNQKYRVKNTGPQTYTLVERLPATEVEIANGEQPVRVKNEKTGAESVVLEADLQPIKERTAEERAAGKGPNKKDLDDELRRLGMEPDTFKTMGQKREAIRRAKLKGPGSPSVYQGPDPKAQIEQLEESFRNIQGRKVPLSEKIRQAFDLGEKIAAGKDVVSRAVAGLKSTGDYLIKQWEGYNTLDELLKAKGDLSAELERRGWSVRKFARSVRKAIPDPRQRAAIAKWVDAGGDQNELHWGSMQTRPEYRQAYVDAMSLSGDSLTAAENIRNFFDSRLQEAIDAGVLEDGIEDYIHRIYEKDPKAAQRMAAYAQSGILSRNPALAKKRIFQLDWESERLGFRPVQDFLPRITAYETSLSKAIAARNFIKKAIGFTDENGNKIKGLTASDGRPVIDVAGIGIPIDDAEGIREVTLINPSFKPGDTKNPLNERGDYKERPEYSALRKWKWATTDGEGKPVYVQGNVVIHPQYAERIDALLKPSSLRFTENKLKRGLFRTAIGVSSTVKQTMLDFSGFHQVQIAIHALEHRVNPLNLEKDIDFSNPDVDGLLKGGATLGGEYRESHAGEGLVGRSLSRLIPGVSELMQTYHEYLFQDFIPRIKMTMALHALERNRSRFADEVASGKMSQEEIYHLTANQANAAFGELNYITLERSKAAQDWSRLILLAPDFLEARGRFAAQAFTKHGTEQRTALLLGALTMYTLARVANQLIDGQPHLEPENAFSLVYKNKAYSLRTVQGDILHLIEKPVQFWMSRLNPVYGRSLLEMATGRDYFGRKRIALEQIWDGVTTMMPISLRSSHERKLWESLVNGMGVTARRYNDTDEAFKLAQKWKDKNGVGMKGEFIYDSNKDPLRPLKLALSNADDAGAVKEIKNLVDSKKMSVAKLNDYFSRYAAMPFTGSQQNDRKFMQTLDADQKKTVEAARQHKREIRSLYQKAREKYFSALHSRPPPEPGEQTEAPQEEQEPQPVAQ